MLGLDSGGCGGDARSRSRLGATSRKDLLGGVVGIRVYISVVPTV